jgi:hypothetical protein
MWLCTKIGFFSIVKKDDGYHVRARVRKDLENLQALLKKVDVVLPEIERWPTADYRHRIRLGNSPKALQWILIQFAEDLDYANFKGVIAGNDEQRNKLRAYSQLHHEGCKWQDDEVYRDRVNTLISGSVDDLKSSLPHYTDDEDGILEEAYETCVSKGLKTKAKLLNSRLNQILGIRV